MQGADAGLLLGLMAAFATFSAEPDRAGRLLHGEHRGVVSGPHALTIPAPIPASPRVRPQAGISRSAQAAGTSHPARRQASETTSAAPVPRARPESACPVPGYRERVEQNRKIWAPAAPSPAQL